MCHKMARIPQPSQDGHMTDDGDRVAVNEKTVSQIVHDELHLLADRLNAEADEAWKTGGLQQHADLSCAASIINTVHRYYLLVYRFKG